MFKKKKSHVFLTVFASSLAIKSTPKLKYNAKIESKLKQNKSMRSSFEPDAKIDVR